VGARNITIAKINLEMSDLTFRTQVTATVTLVLNAYYGLVGDYEDLKAKQGAADTAEKFLSETRRRLELGSVAELDVTTAANQHAGARQALVNSQVALAQQEVQLKNLISRNGLGDPAVAAAHIVPLDRLVMPASDDLPPVKELVEKALANRSDLLTTQSNIRTSEISALGTTNGVLPTVQVFGSRSTSGLAGTARIVPRGGAADPRFVGGIGNALSQVFAQDFPTESIGVGGRFTIHNRQAQADSGIDQLSLRQQQLSAARGQNQAQVDVTNAVVAMQQSRSRYDAAVQNRILQQKLYDAEQKKLAAGESTTYNVTRQLRDFNNAQSAELAALVSYQNARINIDQTTGAILETNHISIADVKAGRITERSVLPSELPGR